MKKIIVRAVFFLVLIVLTLSFSVNSFAAGDEEPTVTPTPEEEVVEETSAEPLYGGAPVYGGEPVYGGGVISPREGDVLVEKMVLNPASGIFVDNLGPTDPKYRPLQIITFQVRVQNPGEETLENVSVVDSLPDFVDFMSGPGSYDQDNRQLSWTVERLDGGSSEVFDIKARISHQATLPEDKEVVCPVNVIEANSDSLSDRDESQFCLQKEIPVEEVPQTGAGHWILAGFGSTLIAGLYLRRKAILN